jgi:hypothetical protein
MSIGDNPASLPVHKEAGAAPRAFALVAEGEIDRSRYFHRIATGVSDDVICVGDTAGQQHHAQARRKSKTPNHRFIPPRQFSSLKFNLRN